jgi:hypothetical protein
VKLTQARQAYYDFSKNLSDINRALGFAGIALIWLFKQQDPSRISIPRALHLPTILIVISLSLDFLQYAWSTAAWGGFARLKEKELRKRRSRGLEVRDDEDVPAPAWINRPTLAFFWAKFVAMIIAYTAILHFLLEMVW